MKPKLAKLRKVRRELSTLWARPRGGVGSVAPALQLWVLDVFRMARISFTFLPAARSYLLPG